ncbi:MAG TPA: hypothetical protein VJV79_27255 [Polyangiaceae bacterium]|nr:hypothetical protein [Polyangiaceae bacterium]
MQIYGDASSEMSVADFAAEVSSRVGDLEGLQSLRAILIACGQLEQLVLEANQATSDLRDSAQRATDHAAAAFYTVWSRENVRAPRPNWQIGRELQDLRAQLARLTLAEGAVGRLNLPEGFAFYALYPEQYCAAAVAYWGRHGPGQGCTHVLGLRSIGTTLSAAVAVVLRAGNAIHRRYSVRPYGQPFQRQIELTKPIAGDERVLVVDEGPGLSGSSFFAAYSALNALGVAARRQVYFCAHPHPPGKMASRTIHTFWQQAERFVASNHDSSISTAGGLCSTIRYELSRHFGTRVLSLEDISGGRWRGQAFAESTSWPAAYAAFERPKLIARLADGRRVVLKYYGQVLRPDAVAQQVDWSDRAAARQISSSDSSVATIHGYVARYWLEGELLSVGDKSDAILERLAKFVASRPWQRLNDERSAARAYYGATGALGPQEWLRALDGRVVKLPETLAGYDHTAVRSEPLGWDLAAVVVEWQLTVPETEQLLASFRAHSGLSADAPEISPHIRRYACFCMAKARFCADQSAGWEASRLENEAVRYAAYSNGIS